MGLLSEVRRCPRKRRNSGKRKELGQPKGGRRYGLGLIMDLLIDTQN
jgi:hypothetical protein